MSQPLISLGHYGVHLKNRLAFHQQENSGFAILSAFPLGPRREETTRNSGWVWGLGGGVTDFLYNRQKLLAPSFYFWEIMLGRGTNAEDMGFDTGLLGFFETSFRDERPDYQRDLRQVLADNTRSLPEHRRSVNIRIGASFSPYGNGIVEQHGRRFSTSFYYHLQIPHKAPEWRSSINLDFLLRINSWLLLVMPNSFFAAFNDKKNDVVDDLKYITSTGVKGNFYFNRRNLLEIGFEWKYLRASQNHFLSPWPVARLNYELAF